MHQLLFRLCHQTNTDVLIAHIYPSSQIAFYQEIGWGERFGREGDSLDVCMTLDTIVQICSSYRPHYHEVSAKATSILQSFTPLYLIISFLMDESQIALRPLPRCLSKRVQEGGIYRRG